MLLLVSYNGMILSSGTMIQWPQKLKMGGVKK